MDNEDLEIIERYESVYGEKQTPEQVCKILALKKHFKKSRVRRDDSIIVEYETKLLDDYIEPEVSSGRKPNSIDNKIVSEFLFQFEKLHEFDEQYLFVDDILTGVAKLDLGGNTRDLSKYMLFNLISTMSVITVKGIEDKLGIKVRQAQKIFVSLKVINRMLEKEIKALL